MRYSLYLLLILLLTARAETAFSAEGESRGERFVLQEVTGGLKLPWAGEFIDQDTLIFTERAGRIGLYSQAEDQIRYLSGVPEVYFRGQGGLLDLKPSPEFAEEPWLYVTYSAYPSDRTEASDKAVTVLARVRLEGTGFASYRLNDWQVLLETDSATDTDYHFGSRIAFDPGRYVYFSVGDRGKRPNGQNTLNHAGSIMRVTFTGRPSWHNPFAERRDEGRAEIWSYGHRNPQGLAYDKQRKRLWAIEHGPRGGDELNLIRKGENYGWPEVSQGKEYWGPIAVGVEHKEGMTDPQRVYIPSIAPSSLLVYSGKAFPRWRGDLFAGALAIRHLNHIQLTDDGRIIGESRLLESLDQRIRDVIESPEGWLYLLTDSGGLYRIVPAGP